MCRDAFFLPGKAVVDGLSENVERLTIKNGELERALAQAAQAQAQVQAQLAQAQSLANAAALADQSAGAGAGGKVQLEGE